MTIPNIINFGFIEKKFTDYEKKVIIGADDFVFEFFLYLPTSKKKPYKTVVTFTEKEKQDLPYEEFNSLGYGVCFFKNSFLSCGEIEDEAEIPFLFLRILDYLFSSDSFDKDNIIFAGKGATKAASFSKEKLSVIEADDIDDILSQIKERLQE